MMPFGSSRLVFGVQGSYLGFGPTAPKAVKSETLNPSPKPENRKVSVEMPGSWIAVPAY